MYKDCFFIGALRAIRTPDPQLRRLLLYPAELGAHFIFNTKLHKILPLSTNNLLLAPNFCVVISKLTFRKKLNMIV